MKLYFETPVKANYLKIKNGTDKDLFDFLVPPWAKVSVTRFDGVKKGCETHLKIKQGLLSHKWVALITHEKTVEGEWVFVDEGKELPWPLTYWRHEHRILRVTENESKIIDDITYECFPYTMELLVKPVLWATLAIRPARYKKFFED